MKHLDLFSGIGGFALAARWVGWQTIGFVEIDPFCQKVLKKHWPGVQIEGDIRKITGNTFRERPDIITGGFPCQPFSVAGKRRGTADDRHLWPEMVRVIKEYQPRWVLGENVAGIIPMELDSVLSDLEAAGYEAWPIVIPACGVDAKHRRMRVWIVAHSNGGRSEWITRQTNPSLAHANESGPQGRLSAIVRERGNKRVTRPGNSPLADTGVAIGGWASRTGRRECGDSEATGDGRGNSRQANGEWFPEPNVGRVANGIPNRVDRLRSLGNAIVPQVAYEIFRAIENNGEVMTYLVTTRERELATLAFCEVCEMYCPLENVGSHELLQHEITWLMQEPEVL